MKEIQSKSRIQDIVYIRHITMWCIELEFGHRMTLTRLAAIFNRHHASVIHATKRCENTLGYDKKLNAMLISLDEYLQLRGFSTLAKISNKLKQLKEFQKQWNNIHLQFTAASKRFLTEKKKESFIHQMNL